MSAYLDMVGKQFGRLFVEQVSQDKVFQPKKGKPVPYLLCTCTCGKQKDILANNLKSGKTLSCGCLHREQTSKARTTHGHTRVGADGKQVMSKEYKAWAHMLSRCYDEHDGKYHVYGARGIIVCPEWRESFEAFFAYVGAAPSSAYSLDRERVHGNYEPGNVRWATTTEQAYNKQNTVRVRYRRKSYTLLELEQRTGIPRETLRVRIKNGWTVREAVETPLRGRAKP